MCACQRPLLTVPRCSLGSYRSLVSALPIHESVGMIPDSTYDAIVARSGTSSVQLLERCGPHARERPPRARPLTKLYSSSLHTPNELTLAPDPLVQPSSCPTAPHSIGLREPHAPQAIDSTRDASACLCSDADTIRLRQELVPMHTMIASCAGPRCCCVLKRGVQPVGTERRRVK